MEVTTWSIFLLLHEQSHPIECPVFDIFNQLVSIRLLEVYRRQEILDLFHCIFSLLFATNHVAMF